MAFCAGSSRPANALLAADMQTEWSKVALPRTAIPACALLNSKIGVNVTHVPYRGSALRRTTWSPAKSITYAAILVLR
jgi:hypothetical protein